MNPQQVVASAMEVLRKMYGEDIPEPVDAITSGWHTVPTSFGTYSNLPPASTGNHMKVRPMGGRMIGCTRRDWNWDWDGKATAEE